MYEANNYSFAIGSIFNPAMPLSEYRYCKTFHVHKYVGGGGIGLPFLHGQVETMNDVVASFVVAAMVPFSSRATTGLTDLTSCTDAAIRGCWLEPGLVNNTI